MFVTEPSAVAPDAKVYCGDVRSQKQKRTKTGQRQSASDTG